MSPERTGIRDGAAHSDRSGRERGGRVGVVALNADGVVRGSDPGVERILGYDPGGIRGTHYATLLADESSDPRDGDDPLAVASDTGRYRGAHRLDRQDGAPVTVDLVLVRIPVGESHRGFAMVVRERGEETGRADEFERYEAMLAPFGEAACVLDADGRVAALNEALMDLTGEARGKLLGTHVSGLLSAAPDGSTHERGEDGRTSGIDPSLEERREPGDASVERVLLDGESAGEATARLRTGSGGTIPVEVECERVRSGGRYRGTVAVFREPTGRDGAAPPAESFAEHVSGVVAVLDAEGTVRRVWPPIDRVLGYDPDELVGENGLGYVHPDDRSAVEEAFDTVAAPDGDRVERVEYRFRTADGTWVWFESSLHERGTGREEYLVTSRGISERKRRERELAEERKFVETALDTLADIFYVVTPDGEFVRWNDELPAATGYSDEEIDRMNALEFFEGEDVERIRAFFEEVMETGGGTVEADLVRKDGTAVPYASRGRRLVDPEGNTVGICGISRDISERKERERALRRERAFTESIIDTIPDVVYAFDEERAFLRWNEAVPEVTGYDDGEIGGMDPSEFVPEEDSDELRAAMEAVFEEGRTVTLETELVTSGGDRIPHEFTGAPLTDETGAVTGLVGTGRDISDRKRRERRLARFERAVEASGHAIFVTDPDGRIEYVNPAFESITGYPEGEVLGRSPRVLKSGRHGESFYRDLWETVLEGEVWEGELVNRRRSGQLYYAEQTVAPVTDDSGALDCLVAVQQDVTARREQEHELARRHEELETLNRIHRLVEDVIRELTTQATREDIEETVRESLLESERYAPVMVIDLPPGLFAGGDGGVDEGVLESIAAELDPIAPDLDAESVERGVLFDAVRDGEIRVVQRVEADPQLPAAARDALLEDGIESVAVVPFGHGENRYGALFLGAGEPDAFHERERAAFGALAEAIGLATYAVRNERLLLTDAVEELTFEAADPDACLARLADELGCECTLEGVVPGSDGSLVLFAGVAGAAPEDVERTVDGIGNIASHRVRPEGESECVLEATVCPDCLLSRIDRVGATVRALRTGPDGAHLIVEAAPDASLPEVSRAVRGRSSGWRLAGKRTVDRSAGAGRPLHETVEDRLTERQYGVLRAAYLAEYFEFPRGSTAEEVAETLGISDATFHQHLRAAKRKLVTQLFETVDAPGATTRSRGD